MLARSIPLSNLNAIGHPTQPSSLSSGWKTLGYAITATTAVTPGALGADTNTVATVIPFYRTNGQGTNIRVRVIYDDDATAVSTALKYKLWGRKSPSIGEPAVNEDWQVLQNRAGSFTVTPTFDVTNDTVIATDYRATGADIDECTHDCDGCDEFFLEVTQGMALTGGTDSQARFQVKII